MTQTNEISRALDTRAAEAKATVLTNGRYAVLLTAAGGGYSAFGAHALTRWTPDRTQGADGIFLYLRDVDSGAVWSAGYQPTAAAPDRYDARFAAGRAEIVREDGGIETRTEVCVAREADAELRRFTLTNRSDHARRVELTTYAEVVLNTPAADAAHPAFSKLFVQTGWLPERQALVAWRRLRSPEDEPLWLLHRLVGLDGEPERESDRMRFIGRGRTLAAPCALESKARLGGTVGNVLDPVFSLRRVVTLEPGASVRFAAIFAAAHTRDAVESLADRFASLVSVDAAFRQAPEGSSEDETSPDFAALHLPETWTRHVEALGSVDADPPIRSAPRYRPVSDVDPESFDALDWDEEPLQFFNGHGGFSADGREYVIRLASGRERPPLPWTNVVANEEAGFLVSESGAGYTWSANSRENRLTPWLNDPVSDPHGEALYLRDEDAGVFWSPTPGPVPGAGAYEARHGFGYTRWRHAGQGLRQETVMFVPRREPVKLVRLRITNTTDRPRRLSAFAYFRWVLGVLPQESGWDVRTEIDREMGALSAINPNRGEFSGRVAFAAAVAPSSDHVSWTADRAAFLGAYGTPEHPAALASAGALDGRAGDGLDPCAAFQLPLHLAPGETADLAFLLGEAADESTVREVLAKYRDVGAIDAGLEEARAFWREITSAVQIETPSPELDLMVNGWLAYQNLSCRVWGRSAFYQSGGAFGFRDQLQDSSALVYLDPALTRRQIVLHASHQFAEGDVLHWWHPPVSKGIRTRFSDDLLWLPYITAFYVATTGDAAVLDEEVPFVTARHLNPGEDEAFVFPQDAGRRAGVYEHCCMTIDRSLTRGAHGLPLMGTGDWNDGMNRVGREGKGESVWLGFFLFGILGDFIPICAQRGDAERAARYRAFREELGATLNDTGWDGAWYRRAYYDHGAPLGSAANDECRIDAIAQAWAVLSGAAPPARAKQALDALEAHLVSEEEGIIRLLTPAFDRTPYDPGYIKGYLPGVRENGGQYTHGALWAVRALAQAGRAERAARLLEMISPVSHGRTPEEVAVYQVEPYVIAADVYGVAPHVGRGGWTWYTGSAGWMYRVALESILGFRVVDGRAISLRPCIPAAWPGFSLRWRLPDGHTTYEIAVTRGTAPQSTVTLDGRDVAQRNGEILIPLATDGAAHRVEVVLAHDSAPTYTPEVEIAAD